MADRTFHKNYALFAVAIISVVALWLRARDLIGYPLWLDEAYSAFAAEKSFGFIWRVLPTYETHPPLYSAILRCWILISGTSVLAYRSFGVVIGMLTIGAVYCGARELARLCGRAPLVTAILVIALAAVSPALISMVRQVRPYSLLCLDYAIGLWAILRLMHDHKITGKLSPVPWCIYLACQAFLFWLHNLGALYVAGLGLACLILIGPLVMLRNHWRMFFIGHALVLLTALPALLIMIDQATTWTQSTWLTVSLRALPSQLQFIFGLPGIFAMGAAAVLLVVGTLTLGADRVRLAAALIVMAFTPILLSLGISALVAPVFLVRTLIACGIPLLFLMAAGLGQGPVMRVIFIILLGLSVQNVIQVQALPPDQDWYKAVRWLAPQMGPNDVVYAYPNEASLAYRFALRDLNQTAPIRDIPSGIPASDPAGWFPTGSRATQSLPTWRLTQIARDRQSQNAPTIWLLRLNKQYYDINDNFLTILKQDRREIARFNYRGIDISGLRQSAAKSPQIAPPKQAQP